MKNKNLKKIFSAFAVLAISASVVTATLPLAACGDGGSDEASVVTPAEGNAIAVSTAVGTSYINTEEATVYYVSPTASATDGEPNNINNPYYINNLLGSATLLKPGDIVYLLPGTYKMVNVITMTVSGTYDNYISILNAAYFKDYNDYTGTETNVTLDYSDQEFASTARGIQINGDYIYWYGIDICGAGDNGMYVAGSYNTIEYSDFYNNRDTGLQLGRAFSDYTSIEQWPSYNLIKNCTSHNNYDNETYGENADGFAAKLTVGYGNVFDGCIAYRNSDDGWDMYAKSDSGKIGLVILYNCVAYENGFLEYTQAENNARFKAWTGVYDEENTNSYDTRLGDGNGFKLGGQSMEGEVIMYNCLSFNNKLHGVTDNSKPTFLNIKGVTSYDNSAIIDDDPDSPTFGQVVKGASADSNISANIDVARYSYSYNSLSNILSATSGLPTALKADAYRGSVTDSVLGTGATGTKTNYVAGSIDADTTSGAGGQTYTSQGDVLDPADIFVELPIEYNAETGEYTYNASGLKDLGVDYKSGAPTNAQRAHVIYRNADGSINMGDLLALKDGVELIEGATVGSYLNKSSWEDYEHYLDEDLFSNITSQSKAVVARAQESLSINCDENAVYQDFQVPTHMTGCDISWTSSNTEFAEVGTEKEISISESEYITIIVYRQPDKDVEVKLTATITYGTETATKDFILTIKQGIPKLGDVTVVEQDGNIITNGDSIIIDQYALYREPTIQAANKIDYNGKLLDESAYTVESTYTYAANKNARAVEVAGFTPSNAGVFTITHKVTLNNDKTQTATMSYTIFVASAAAEVDFDGDASIVVNRHGYTISGDLTSATGTIYALSSAQELTDITAENIKSYEGVESYTFRANSIGYQFTNENLDEYYIYYALENLNGVITSEIYSAKVEVVEISTTAQFRTIAGGAQIGAETPSTTIYKLANDLDFSEYGSWAWSKNDSVKAFTGLFTGAGHTIRNLTVSGGTASGYNSVFYKVNAGTIENVKFDNILIEADSTDKAGIVGESTGGYFYNIAITDITITGGGNRHAALIGHIGGSSTGETAVSDTSISQVSVINSDGHSLEAGSRAAGLIGYVQYYGANITIDNCMVITDMTVSSEAGGMISSWEDKATDTLTIINCYYAGTFNLGSSTRAGGMLGYHKGGLGSLYVSGCLSLAKFIVSGDTLLASMKNASPIIGNYSIAAPTTIVNCIGLMAEYNEDYDSTAYSLALLKRSTTVYEKSLGFDTETKWSFVYDDGGSLTEPILMLNFLGDWN